MFPKAAVVVDILGDANEVVDVVESEAGEDCND
jgi:hypothetical protein